MPRLVRKDDPSIKIVGICDFIPAVAFFTEVNSLTDFEYDGESRVHWDGQCHESRNGQRVFLDENDQEVLEDQVLLVTDEVA